MKIISCNEAVNLMFEALEKAITKKGQTDLDNHIDECRHCCDRFEFETLFKEKVQGLTCTPEIPTYLEKRIDNMLDAF